MPEKKQIRKRGWTLDMSGIAWSPAALNVAHGLIRTYGRIAIVNLAGQPENKPIEFNKHPALDAWSDGQLKKA
jgi:hypothetical protein